jgi:hypothetical protein
VTEEMLYEAIDQAGGMINRSGHYPISEESEIALNAIYFFLGANYIRFDLFYAKFFFTMQFLG